MAHIPQIAASEIVPFLVLGVLTGVAAPQFLKFLGLTKGLFERTRLPLPARLGLGGLLLAVCCWQCPMWPAMAIAWCIRCSPCTGPGMRRSEEHTSELQSL